MEIIKVEFLNDLEQTIQFLQSYVKESDEIKKLEFFSPGKIDGEYSYERIFKSLEDVKRDYKQEFYEKAKRITFIIKKPDDLVTIYCDKEKSSVAIVKSNEEKKEEIQALSQEKDINDIAKDDGCTYYLFEFGQIGKYDPATSCYYLYTDGKFEISGTVMRWVEDPAYDYKIIGGQNDLHK